MQTTVYGFNQKSLIELELDAVDTLILRYFVDFIEGAKFETKVIDKRIYYWIPYDEVLDHLPILNMKKYTVQSRFFKLRDLGILTHYVHRKSGTYSYFGIGKNFRKLLGNKKYSYLTKS